MQPNNGSPNRIFDRLVKQVLIGVVILMAFFLLLGDKTFPKVIKVNVNNETVSASQRQIVFTFNRTMDRKSVEQNFSITPQVEGTFSWSGKNFAFTPVASFPYGKRFQLKISKDAQDEDGKNLSKDFTYNFQTNILRFAYLAVDGEHAKDIIVSDLAGQDLAVLPTHDYTIDNFLVAPDGQKIYFLGYKSSQADEQLFEVDITSKKITQLTQGSEFLNKAFQLSPDGKYLTLSRVEVSSTGEITSSIQLWIASVQDFKFTKFKGGRGTGLTPIFTPDGSSLLYQNGDGNFELGTVDAASKDQPIYIGEYSQAYSFHPFKPLIAFTKYDEGDVFSLNDFLVLFNGDGTKMNLPLGQGIARDTAFTADGKKVLTIFSGPKDVLTESGSLSPLRIFHLYSYDLESQKLEKLTDDEEYSEEMPVVSSDSRNLLFLRYDASQGNKVLDPEYRDLAANLGATGSGGEVWSMDLSTGQMKSLGISASRIQFFQ